MLKTLIDKIGKGYSEGIFDDKKYGITKTVFNNGNSLKIYAEELGGNDFISLNYYITKSKGLLKPCEMSEQKVIDFLQNVTLFNTEENSTI
jgi:peptide-methionine (S)-S-oxide reductase